MTTQRIEAETATTTLAAHIIASRPDLCDSVTPHLPTEHTPTATIWEAWRALQAIAATHGIDQAPLYGSTPGTAPHPVTADAGTLLKSLHDHFNLSASALDGRDPNPRERAIRRDIFTVAYAIADHRRPSQHTLNRLHIVLV